MADSTALGEPALDALDIPRVTELEVCVTDALAAGEQIVGELLGLELHVLIHLLEPLHAVSRSALKLECLHFTLRLVADERLPYSALAVEEHARERERILHRELGAGADAEVCGMRRVAN